MGHGDRHDNPVDVRDGGDSFLTDTRGLPPAVTPETVDLRDGDVFDGDPDVLVASDFVGYVSGLPSDAPPIQRPRGGAIPGNQGPRSPPSPGPAA